MKSGLFLLFLSVACSLSAQQVVSTAPPAIKAQSDQAKGKGAPGITTDEGNARPDKQDPEEAQRQQIIDLLERSHGIDDEVLPDQKSTLLARQISLISRLKPETGKKWAQELFQLGADQSDDQKRARIQMTAIQMVAPGDPEFALGLLHQMKPAAETDPNTAMLTNPLSSAATTVFQELARKKGTSQLPRLRQEALRLASESQYPYSAMGAVAVELYRESKHKDTQHANQQSDNNASVLESVFDEAMTNYQQSVPGWSANADFGRMLQRLAYQLPKDKVHHALEVFVSNVQNTPGPSGTWMKVASATGSTQVNDPVDIVLFHYLELLANFAPDLLKQVNEAHPQLAQLQSKSDVTHIQFGNNGTMTGPDLNEVARLRAQGMAGWDPDSALAVTQSINDPNTRAVTMGNVAAQVADDEPGRALQLMDQAQKTAADSKDLKTELQLISSRAEVAERTKNSAMLRESLRNGFEVGDQLLRQEQDENQGPVSWYLLGSLVQTGIESDPDLTLSYINSFSLPYVRAELLLDAAQGLRFRNWRVARNRVRSLDVAN